MNDTPMTAVMVMKTKELDPLSTHSPPHIVTV